MFFRNKKVDTDDYQVLESKLVVEKGKLFQQRACCSKTHVDVTQCKEFLTAIVAAINRCDYFTEDEATEIFFALTKLFTSRDLMLRRLLYVALDDMIPTTSSSFILVNTVTKDLSEKITSFRCSSLRCLSRLVTPQLVPSLERFFKQTIVDTTPSVQVASLLCCMKLPLDVVTKFIPEINTCFDSTNALVQYHATRLFVHVKQHDIHALVRFITSKGPTLKSYALQELFRVTPALVAKTTTPTPLLQFVATVVANSTDIVAVQALHALVEIGETATLQRALPRLQRLLQSPQSVVNYAALRLVSELATSTPALVAELRTDVEALLKHPNRSIVTLATSASLRVASEATIEKLLRKIGKFISTLPDKFRVQVLQTIEQIAAKYPAKHAFLLTFLGSLLPLKGLTFKNAVITAMLGIAAQTVSLRDTLLETLAALIEDCEYTQVVQRVVGILGEYGPQSEMRTAMMRSVYNRFVLEGPSVRAACVSALHLFGESHGESDAERVTAIMRKCALDTNEEVRSRAVFYLQCTTPVTSVFDELPLDNVEAALEAYLSEGDFSGAFDLSSVSREVVVEQVADPEEERERAVQEEQERKVDAVLDGYGPLIKRCAEVLVSGVDMEYQVRVEKCVFAEHVVLKCTVSNTLDAYQLENITVRCGALTNFEVVKTVGIAVLAPQCRDVVLVVLKRVTESVAESVALQMVFELREVDPVADALADETTEDAFALDALPITVFDFITEADVPAFQPAWDAIPASNEAKTVIKFPDVSSLQGAVDRVKQHFGLRVLDGSDVVPQNAKKHIVYMCGRMEDEVILVRVRLMVDKTGSVPLEICIRSSEALAKLLLATL